MTSTTTKKTNALHISHARATTAQDEELVEAAARGAVPEQDADTTTAVG